MRLDFIHLCDHAFQSEAGKLNIIGIFKNIRVNKFPGGVAKFNLVGSIGLAPKEIPNKFKLETQLINPDGNKEDIKIPTLTGQLPKSDKKIDITFNLEVGGYKFSKSGKHEFNIIFNNKKVGSIDFDIVQLATKLN